MIKSSLSCWFLSLTLLICGCASPPKERIPIGPGAKTGGPGTAIQANREDRKISRPETGLREKGGGPEDELSVVSGMKAYVGERKAIFAAYASQDYPAVIQRCAEVKERFGADAFTPDLHLVLALSLEAEHRYEDALQEAEKVLNGRDPLPDSIQLRLKSAEWHLDLGQKSETAVLLRSVEKSVAAATRQRETLEARMEALTPELPSVSSGASGDGQRNRPEDPSESLERVEALMKEDRFEEAEAVLEENRPLIQAGSPPDTYEQALERLEKAEEQHLQEQIGVISTKEQALSRVKQLLEEEKFEEAIAAVDALGAEESANGNARALLDEAVSGVVNQERNRAAKAFYSAKQTDDPTKKATYLRSSYDILKQLMDKYPSSSLMPKIKSNLNTVESEMTKAGLKP